VRIQLAGPERREGVTDFEGGLVMEQLPVGTYQLTTLLPPSARHESVWALDSEGLLVIVITDEETGAAATTTRFVYRRSR
jgi:hypothetical protein